MDKPISDLVQEARHFASAAHGAVGQRRKYTHDPYIVHPAAVAKLVASVTDDAEMIAAAWLHDTVEDTEATIAQIRESFGPAVAELVGWLTDVSRPEDGNRAVRKERDRQHIARAPSRAKTVKLADLIDNTSSIVRYDPGFARVYLVEKRRLLEVLKEGDQTLWHKAHALAEAGIAELR